jgi:hypothetical protein
MNAPAVQTSAPTAKVDLFDTEGEPLYFDLHGVLLQDAQVRAVLVGEDKHPVPVLWLEIHPLHAMVGSGRTIHAEQIYSEASRKQAEHKAASLKKGARVRITTTFHGMQTILPDVQAVALIS